MGAEWIYFVVSGWMVFFVCGISITVFGKHPYVMFLPSYYRKKKTERLEGYKNKLDILEDSLNDIKCTNVEAIWQNLKRRK